MARSRLQPLLRFVALAFALGTLAVQAAPSDDANREILELLQRLERSGCEFNRNGRWHDAAAARAHLEKKYRHLADRDLVKTAEDFIEIGASKSSMTGKPYEVRCGDRPPVASAPWLTDELRHIRASKTSR